MDSTRITPEQARVYDAIEADLQHANMITMLDAAPPEDMAAVQAAARLVQRFTVYAGARAAEDTARAEVSRG